MVIYPEESGSKDRGARSKTSGTKDFGDIVIPQGVQLFKVGISVIIRSCLEKFGGRAIHSVLGNIKDSEFSLLPARQGFWFPLSLQFRQSVLSSGFPGILGGLRCRGNPQRLRFNFLCVDLVSGG